jgi:stage II sporulation protein GA (sporulation sigma-E factor processing peptidase)
VPFFILRLNATAFSGLFLYTANMKTIYVDDMFLLNLIINYFILLATAVLCALPLKRARFLASAALGALYSVLTLLPEAGFLVTVPMKLCLGVAMVLVSFGGARRILRPFIAFLCVSAAFGGAVYGAALLAGAPVENGLYINASMRVLLLSFAACYLALTLVFKRLGTRQKRRTMEVTIALGGVRASFTALHDTGNELFDPVSGLPVMVVESRALKTLFPAEALAALGAGAAEFMTGVSGSGELKTRFRLVPFAAAGVSRGMLPVFRPDAISINGRAASDILVGICDGRVCSDDEFSAIF